MSTDPVLFSTFSVVNHDLNRSIDRKLVNGIAQVRLKRFLEMRGADCGPLPFINALPAFWVCA